MRVEELFDNSGKNYVRRISVYLDDVKADDKSEVAGMLRGLMCAIEGWGALSGLTNEVFNTESPVIFQFSDVANAHYFKSCVEYYFDDGILARLKVKKRIRTS
jgi:hypothetical protein